jgi:enoyl-CoA hydratase/carnithine racemase
MNLSLSLSEGTLRLEREGPFAWIIVDQRDKHNSLTEAMWRSIPKIVSEVDADENIRVIILRGAGDKAFSAGADISEFETNRQGAAAREYDYFNHAAFDALARTVKPTIAMIHGFCLGSGLGLALSCDMRVASESALFGLTPARLGIAYNPRWIKPLVAIVGVAYAKELLFTAERVDTATALRMRLINHRFPVSQLENATRELAQMISENAPLSILAAKRSIDAFASDLSAETQHHLDQLVERCYASDDYLEGQRAFIEKRKPVFKCTYKRQDPM